MNGGKQGFKRKWGSKKGGPASKRLAPTRFVFSIDCFRSRGPSNAAWRAFKAPASTWKGLSAFGSVGNKKWKPSTSIQSLGTIFPDRLMVPMRYTQNLTYTITSGVPSGNSYRGNSVYDPDVTGVGAQPYGYDELSTYYNVYRVHDSSAVFRVLPATTTSTATSTLIFGLRASWSSTLNLSDVPMWCQTGDGVFSITNTEGISSKANQKMGSTLALRRSNAKMLGQTDLQSNMNTFLDSAAAANPTAVAAWYWNTFITTLDGSTSSTAFGFIDITYYVTWSRRSNVGSSA